MLQKNYAFGPRGSVFGLVSSNLIAVDVAYSILACKVDFFLESELDYDLGIVLETEDVVRDDLIDICELRFDLFVEFSQSSIP